MSLVFFHVCFSDLYNVLAIFDLSFSDAIRFKFASKREGYFENKETRHKHIVAFNASKNYIIFTILSNFGFSFASGIIDFTNEDIIEVTKPTTVTTICNDFLQRLVTARYVK